MAGWWSIEVFHGEVSARRWQDTSSSALIESALSHGATSLSPRRPWPSAGAGAMALPEPGDEPVVRLAGVTPPGVPEPAQAGAL